jgi:ankyrin repeat protein
LAAFEAFPARVRALLELGADPNERVEDSRRPYSWDGWSPLEMAGCGGVVEALLAGGAKPGGEGPLDRRNALHRAKNGSVVEALVKAGVDPNEACAVRGNTPVMRAARDNRLDALAALLRAGGKVDARNRDGATALHFAGSRRAVELLAEAGADVEATKVNGDRPLHAAVASGLLEVVEALLDAGADVNARNRAGENALWAVDREWNGEAVARALLAAGVDQRAARCDGRILLGDVALSGQAHAVEMLIRAGCDVNVSDAAGNTPLHYLARNELWGRCDMLSCMQRAKVDPFARNAEGLTPRDVLLMSRSRGTSDLWRFGSLLEEAEKSYRRDVGEAGVE